MPEVPKVPVSQVTLTTLILWRMFLTANVISHTSSNCALTSSGSTLSTLLKTMTLVCRNWPMQEFM